MEYVAEVSKKQEFEKNIVDVVPKSAIKTKQNKPLGVNQIKQLDADVNGLPNLDNIRCSIVIDGKIIDNVEISRASIEAALQPNQLISRMDTEQNSTPIITETTLLASKVKVSARPTSAKTPRTPKTSNSLLPFRGIESRSRDEIDVDRSEYFSDVETQRPAQVLVANMKTSTPKGAKKGVSPRVQIKRNKSRDTQRAKQKPGGFNPRNESVPECFQVKRGFWNGASGGPGWIGLDTSNDNVPILPRSQRSSVGSTRASAHQTKIEEGKKWTEEDSPFVPRRKIINSNECSTPSNVWTPDMAFERYGNKDSGGGMFNHFM